MIKLAVMSKDNTYRYSLTRIWELSLPRICFIMLNPSTADHKEDDPTIRRVMGFSKSLGFGSVEVVNLFAYRATDPENMKRYPDPIGPENNQHIFKAVEDSTKVILAWGNNGTFMGRNEQVMEMLKNDKHLYALEVSKPGHPKHPLFLKLGLEPVLFTKEARENRRLFT